MIKKPMDWISPMIIEERKLNTASIDVFSRLMQERIIFIGSQIDAELANTVQAQLLYMNAVSNDPITIYINTPGGSVIDGLAIYDTMRFVKSKIVTVCTGMAASMGSILLVAGDERKILPNGRVLIHQPSSYMWGTAADLTIEVEEVNKDKKRLYEILAKHTGQPYEKIIQDSQRDFWLDANDALEYGCVDQIINSSKE